MKAFVIGTVLLAVTLITWIALPSLLTSGQRGNEEALRQAIGANRLASIYSPGLEHFIDGDMLAKVKEAELQRLVDAAAQQAESGKPETAPADGSTAPEPPVSPFVAMANEQNARVQAANEADRKLSLPAGHYESFPATEAALKKATDNVVALKKYNNSVLADALKNAQEAYNAGRGIVGVAQALGNTQFVQAASLYIDAALARTQLAELHCELAQLTMRYTAARADLEYYDALDGDDIAKSLTEDLTALKTDQEQATAAAADLDAKVAAREGELATVRADMEAARKALDTLEQRGFKAGDDAAFAAYSKSYSEGSEKLRKLQEREQELANGGIQGATLADDAIETAPIQGGSSIDGLAELQRRQSAAHLKADRLTAGVAAIQKAIDNARTASTNAGSMKKDASKSETDLKGQLAALLTKVNEAADTASKKEDAALAATDKAITAFKESESNGQAYSSNARSQQGEVDPQNQNPRLTTIASDATAAAVGTSGTAEAQMLRARILRNRNASLTRHIALLQTYSAAVPGSKFDDADLQDKATAAAGNAKHDAEEAAKKFEALARTSGAGQWAPLSSQAAAEKLLADVDRPDQRARHLTNAFDLIKKALDKRDKHPLVATEVLFRAELAKATGQSVPESGGGAPPASEGAAPDGEKKPENPETPG